MRKLVVSINVTLDGYIAGTDDELDWHFERWTADMGVRLTEELSGADTILLGRNTYTAMAGYWPSKAWELLGPREDIAFAVMMNNCHKAVYSHTLQKAGWNNSELVTGNIREAVTRLKQPGSGRERNILVYGSGRLVAALMPMGLIDEYRIWIHPVVLGAGRPLFAGLKRRLNMRLCRSKTFSSGVVLLCYTSLATADH